MRDPSTSECERVWGMMEAIVPPIEVVAHNMEIVKIMVAGRDQMEKMVNMVAVAMSMAIMMSMVVEMVAMVATIMVAVMVEILLLD